MTHYDEEAIEALIKEEEERRAQSEDTEDSIFDNLIADDAEARDESSNSSVVPSGNSHCSDDTDDQWTQGSPHGERTIHDSIRCAKQIDKQLNVLMPD